MYEYKAKVVRVVDGDTMDCEVDLGFKIYTRIRIRVDNFNAPEIYHADSIEELEKGRMAKLFAVGLIEGKTVTLRSTYQGPYNRWGATLILEDGRDFVDVMVESNLGERVEYKK